MKIASAIVTTFLLVVGLQFCTAMGQPPPIPAQEQPQVLTRGPVHEAFSEPVILQNQTGLVVPNQPPADIEEIPPAERPQGDQYVWVPGYWSWDGDRTDYIWVSGCWRAAPPDMSWVPGYWSQESEGFEWVAGFWTPSDIQDLEYLPAPPASYDEQPSGSSPSPNDIWVPSCQYWQQNHYVERHGYWLAGDPNWVWTPSHYIWTPRGYIFCDGHWDYPLEDRGMLFAPVYFPQAVYSRSGYSYSPSIVLDLGVLTVNLFTYPRYNHYYFGDYYGDSYLTMGIYPRYEVDQRHSWYDPTYEFDRWHHRDEPRWVESQRQEYDVRHQDKSLRPPRTYQEMETRVATNLPTQQREAIVIAAPLTVVVASTKTPLRYEHVDTKTQQTIATQATAAHSFRAERKKWEAEPTSQKAVQLPTKRQGTVAPVPDKRTPSSTAENKGRMTGPGERKGQVAQPRETNAPTTPPRDVRATQPKETNAPITPSRDVRATQPKETNAPIAPSRDVRMTRPERVKVPALPTAGRHAPALKNTPPRPVNERDLKGNTKVVPDKNQEKVNPKDKGKGKGKGK